MNYYEILKVSQKASDSEIKTSYKKLVKKYHPDLYVGDKNFAEQKIKEINEAYDILSNPETRKEYDDYLNPPIQTPPTYQSSTKANYDSYNSQTQKSEYSSDTFSDLIIKHFNKLDKKLQLKIFIAILIIILSLFLINLIEMQNFLMTEENNNITNTISTPNSNTQNSITKNSSPENHIPYYEYFENYYNETTYPDANTIDAFLYELLKEYEEEYNRQFQNIQN